MHTHNPTHRKSLNQSPRKKQQLILAKSFSLHKISRQVATTLSSTTQQDTASATTNLTASQKWPHLE